MSLKIYWLLWAIAVSLPYLLLGAAGLWWLYITGWLVGWMFVAALISLLSWLLMGRLRKYNLLESYSAAGPSQDWSPTARKAWTDVEQISRRKELADTSLERPEPLLAIAKEVVESVAKQFHPHSKNPSLEMPVPHLLRIAELVARDLRQACSANIPGSHILTINDLVKLQRLFSLAPSLYRIYRVIALIINPSTALARELSVLGQEQMLSASRIETKRWALEFAIKKTGYYAIELYSGQLLLRGFESTSYTTQRSRVAMDTERDHTQAIEGEPLRILVLGQVKAGKSSLINAIFGEMRAAVDIVPRTKGVDAYLLEREGIKRAIILDTAGYEDAAQTTDALNWLQKEIQQCDLIVLVSSALTAARASDRRLLDEVRRKFQSIPDREFPPLVIALTHIDQLRPYREWSPPFNLNRPDSSKATHIRAAMEAVAFELQVELSQIVPVCLLTEMPYNVEEGLVSAIVNVLGPAERLKYLRCLREYKDESYWTQIWQQAANAGRILVNAGFQRLT